MIVDALLSLFGKIGARLQWLTGRDCLDQARVFGVIGVLSTLGVEVMLGVKWEWYVLDALVVPMVVMSGIDEDESIRSGARGGMRNFRRLAPFCRAAILFWFILLGAKCIASPAALAPAGAKTLGLFVDVSMLCYSALRCCDPLPPCGNAWERLLESLRVPALIPVPISRRASLK